MVFLVSTFERTSKLIMVKATKSVVKVTENFAIIRFLATKMLNFGLPKLWRC